jgi:hypothetical protein
MTASAVSIVGATGSVASGSQMSSSLVTGLLGIIAQSAPISAHRTLRVCSAEKPAVPKNSRPVRSISRRFTASVCRSAYSTKSCALAASSSPCAETMRMDGCSQRVAKWAL